MNIAIRIITGIAVIILGAYLIYISVTEVIWVLLYGIPLFIVGFFIIFNKKEEHIEPIKKSKK